jgi:RNA polymerase sigma factor (sigma-70 family)
MYEDAGLSWTIPEVAAEIGVDEARARFLLGHGGSISLDQPVALDDPDASTLRQVLAGEAAAPEEECIRDQELERLREAIEQLLDDRLRRVIAARYGLDDDRFRTLTEVGAGLRLSRERVRQLEKRALDLLRSLGEIRSAA